MKFTKATSIHNQRMMTWLALVTSPTCQNLTFLQSKPTAVKSPPDPHELVDSSVLPDKCPIWIYRTGSLTQCLINTVLQDSVVIRLHLATDISDYTVYINNPTTQINTKVCSRHSVCFLKIKIIISRNTFTMWWKSILPVSACILLHQKGCGLFSVAIFWLSKTQF